MCQSKKYLIIGKLLVIYVRFMNITARNNELFYNSIETKELIYDFIVDQCRGCCKSYVFTAEDIIKVIHELIEISFENTVKKNQQLLIKEIMALNTVYKILKIIFKKRKDMIGKLLPQIFYPLELSGNSLMNTYLLSLEIPEYLISILKNIEMPGEKQKLCQYLGNIAYIHTNRNLICKILRNLPKHRETLKSLISMISGTTTTNMFYFDGSPKSYIRIKDIENYSVINGFCFVGNVRIEYNSSKKKMCLWSFLKLSETGCKGVELYFINQKLGLRFVKNSGKDDSHFIIIEKTDFQEDMWHSIAVSLTYKEIRGCLDGTNFEYKVTDRYLPKIFNTGLIGGSYSIGVKDVTDLFFGEMSTLY